MSKSTWRNIYNFSIDSTESRIDINDAVSSISATSEYSKDIKKNLNSFVDNNNLSIVPLAFQLSSQMGGSKMDEDSISTEQLESKLRSIFTNAEPEQQSNVNENLIGGGCGDEESHKISSRGCETDEEGNPVPHMQGAGCETDEEGNPVPHMQGGDNLESLPLIMATQYSDATSFSNKINTSSNKDDDSSTSDSDLVTSNVSSSQLNLVEATQYSDATSFGN